MPNLTEKIAVVTGSSRGVRRGIAQAQEYGFTHLDDRQPPSFEIPDAYKES